MYFNARKRKEEVNKKKTLLVLVVSIMALILYINFFAALDPTQNNVSNTSL
jgi:hypothetical protein